MKHLAEDIMEMINTENKELLEALNELKEHNKLLIEENQNIKQLNIKLIKHLSLYKRV